MYPKISKICFIAVLCVSGFLSVLFTVPSEVSASTTYTAEAKPMDFYFHYIDTPVQLAGLETKYIFNTTRSFRFLTNHEALTNSFYKPVGLPKIVVDFYLYPNLAGPVTIDGLWQVLVWVNASAYKPVNFALEFQEITVGGVELWDSGLITPTVTSSIGEYLDVPVHSYNLSKLLTHTFSQDTTLQVSIEINAGSSADTRVWFDSPLYPSKIILPARDYARPVDVTTKAFDGTETTVFFYNWSQSQRRVTVRTNITDPYGGYDVQRVNMTLYDPANQSVLENIAMQRISDGLWPLQFSQTFEANWSYPSTVSLGNYTIQIAVVDNNGVYQQEDTGSVNPFIEFYTYAFTIGELVYYDPALLIVDHEGVPLPTAQIYMTWPNGSRDILPQYTSNTGFLNLSHILPATYDVTISWKDVVVNQTSVYIDSDDIYTISTAVYHLTVVVADNGGSRLSGVYVMISEPSGLGYGLGITDDVGETVFQVPIGFYHIDAHYSTGYWLNTITTQETLSNVEVNDSITAEIRLTEFPPAIWSTIGFGILVVVIVCIALGVYLGFFRKRPARVVLK